MIVGGRIAVVTRDVEEDSEQYWDRAWCFVDGVARGGDPGTSWLVSLKRPHEKRGVVY